MYLKSFRKSLMNSDFYIVTVSVYGDKIEKYLQKNCESNETVVNIISNNNMLRSQIKSNRKVFFKPKDSISQLLGFKSCIVEHRKNWGFGIIFRLE